MNKEKITLYVDYKSPYAFVAKDLAYQLEQDYPVELDWLPYTLRIEDYLDTVEQRSAHNWRKVRYGYMDARRLANRQGLTLKGPQRIFNAYYASAGMLYAKQNGFFRVYNDAVFESFWKRELDIDSLDAVCAMVASLGGDAAGYRAYAEGHGRTEHDAIRNHAEEIGVFGVPTFVLDGELFFGGDRIPLLIERIEERAQSRAI